MRMTVERSPARSESTVSSATPSTYSARWLFTTPTTHGDCATASLPPIPPSMSNGRSSVAHHRSASFRSIASRSRETAERARSSSKVGCGFGISPLASGAAVSTSAGEGNAAASASWPVYASGAYTRRSTTGSSQVMRRRATRTRTAAATRPYTIGAAPIHASTWLSCVPSRNAAKPGAGSPGTTCARTAGSSTGCASTRCGASVSPGRRSSGGAAPAVTARTAGTRCITWCSAERNVATGS